MGITMNMDGVDGYIQNQIQKRINQILEAMNYVGTTCVDEAKINGSYTDRSSNLRGSIGYMVMYNGAVYSSSSFKPGEGGIKGEALLTKLAAQFPQGIVLILVAGMQYAAHVEAINLNVLTSAELMAEKLMPALMKKLGFETVKK